MTASCTTQAPAYYDAIYRSEERYLRPYYDSPRYLLWVAALDLLSGDRTTRLLEVGCGTGQFAEMLSAAGYIHYFGIDFSPVAIAIADTHGIPCACVDAFTYLSVHSDFDILIALETFEYLDDLALLRLVPRGKKVMFSVPNFADPAHLRFFTSERLICDRYKWLLAFRHISLSLNREGRGWYLALGERY